MIKENVVLKGDRNGVKIVLSPDVPFGVITEELTAKLESAVNFFSKGSCNINFTGRKLTQSEKLELEQTVLRILKDARINIGYETEPVKKPKIFSDINAGYTKFCEGTIRSGQRVESEGNLVIIGDVNPGSEVIAAGSIVVMGAVRGIIHAGCTGNREAYIVALNMSPTQIRIADIITRPPDNDVRGTTLPERAYIKDNNIYIDEYLNTGR
ncbi:MAG: septum site-determining protein MinC [Oscillospiraceae bacterium]|nr:septum site-determining protein MinC [Oscillospiraceae bacterium]